MRQTYTVQKAPPPMHPWLWEVRAYRGDKIVLAVRLKSDSAKDIECAALEGRGFTKR